MRALMTEALRFFCDGLEGPGGFHRLLKRFGLESSSTDPGLELTEELFWRLIRAESERLNTSAETFLERFGLESGGVLPERGGEGGVVPGQWNGLDLLEHLGEVLGIGELPGKGEMALRTFRVHAGEVALALFSGRGFCRFLHGLARGAEGRFGDALVVREPLCQLKGARFCRLTIRFSDRERALRVDLGREFEQMQKTGGKVTFYNTFKGVPISFPGVAMGWSGDELVVRTEDAQLKAMAFAGKTHLSLSHLSLGMVARVRRVDLATSIAVLGEFRLCHGPVGFRRHERVLPTRPIAVHLEVEGETFTGVLRDLSENGMAVTLSGRVNLEKYLFAHFLVQCSLPVRTFEKGEVLELGPQELLLQANLLDVGKSGEEQLCRFVLSKQPSHSAALIRQFILEREREVLPELMGKAGEGVGEE